MQKEIVYRLLLAPLVFSLLLSINIEEVQAADRGYKIATHCEKYNQGYQGELSKADMVLETSSKKKVRRQLEIQRREKDDKGTQSLLKFIKPRDVRGTKLLTWSHQDGQDDQWVYLPSYRRVKRISSRLKTGSFMGSEFSYEDLSGRSVEKFAHKYLKEGKYKGRKVWLLQQSPKDKYSGYSKQIVWMDKVYKNPLKIQYYDRKGELVKVAVFQGYRKINKWWRPQRTIMKNVQTRKQSTLVWKNVQLGQRLSARSFQKEYLKN